MDADRTVIELGPQGRRERVLQVLVNAQSPMRAGELIEALGPGWTITRVMRALRDLEKIGQAKREQISKADRVWGWSAADGA